MKQKLYWMLSFFCFMFFFCWFVFNAFLPIWLKQVNHLSGVQIGTIFGFNAAVTMALQPFYGYILDRLGMRKNLLYFINACILFTAPFFLFVYQPLLASHFYIGAILGAIYLGVAFNAGCAAVESYIEKAGRSHGFEFGRARMWGSLGGAVGVFAAGVGFNQNPSLIFIFSSIGAILMFIFLYSAKLNHQDVVADSKINITVREALGLLKIRNVWILIIFLFGSSCVYAVFDQQFAIYYASLFPTQAEGDAAFGYLNSLQVFLEAAGMFAAPVIVNKIGAKRGLLLAASIMTFRMFGSGLITDVYGISAIKLMHALELPVLLVSIFKYIARNFDNRFASVLYLICFHLSCQFGIFLLSPVAGHLYDEIGFPHTYVILGAIVLTFTILGGLTLVSDKKSAYVQAGAKTA